jgi:hypothetical protein
MDLSKLEEYALTRVKVHAHAVATDGPARSPNDEKQLTKTSGMYSDLRVGVKVHAVDMHLAGTTPQLDAR